MLPTFSQNLTLQEAIETTALINEDPKRTEYDSAFRKKFQTCYLQIFFIVSLNVESRYRK